MILLSFRITAHQPRLLASDRRDGDGTAWNRAWLETIEPKLKAAGRHQDRALPLIGDVPFRWISGLPRVESRGVSESQLAALPDFEDAAEFSGTEKLVLRYAAIAAWLTNTASGNFRGFVPGAEENLRRTATGGIDLRDRLGELRVFGFDPAEFMLALNRKDFCQGRFWPAAARPPRLCGSPFLAYFQAPRVVSPVKGRCRFTFATVRFEYRSADLSFQAETRDSEDL